MPKEKDYPWLWGRVGTRQIARAVRLRQELDALRGDYEKRINRLEARIRDLEAAPAAKRPARKSAPPAKRPVRETSPAEELAEPATSDEGLSAAENRKTQEQALEQVARKQADQRFKEDTETRDIARRPDAKTLLAERIDDVLEGYLDITGYFRAGYGRSNEGGPLQAFGIPGLAKYRLGNTPTSATTRPPSSGFRVGCGRSGRSRMRSAWRSRVGWTGCPQPRTATAAPLAN